jgi:amino acid adenylation domain-containing protein
MNFVSTVRSRAAETPQVVAYTFLADSETEVTYSELDRQARGIGAALQDLGATGERVLLLFHSGLDFIAAFFGCLYAGAVAVPAYPPRSARGLPRLRAILDDARPRVVLSTEELSGRARRLLGGIANLEPMAWLATEGLEARAEEWREPAIDHDTLAFLQYTSGSTATPKGVMVSHGNLLHNEEMIRRAFGQSAESVVVGWLPLYHDMGLIGNVLQPLYLGARCILMAPVAFLQKPLRWLDAISRYRGTTSGGPNFAYELCVRKISAEQRTGLDLSSWRLAFNGAEPVRAEALERFASAFAPCGFRREAFYPCFGLAEATLFATGGEPGEAPSVREVRPAPLEEGRVEEVAAGEAGGRALVGCGRAWLGQRLEVVKSTVDSGRGHPVEPGRVGEIWIAGPSVAQGYWGNAAATERDFRAHLASEPEAGPFLRTGDLGFILGGDLFVTGRLKDLIILRGRNLYPQDLELTAERAHPTLRPGCGAAFSLDIAGEERLVIVQELERKTGGAGDVEPEEIAAAIRAAVAREHEVTPWEVVLLRMGTLPKTSSGKTQRHACRAAYRSGDLAAVARSVAGAEAEIAAEAEEPAEPSREALLALDPDERAAVIEPWLRQSVARALRLAPGRVDPEQSLVALGLDSLSAVELKQEIEPPLSAAVSLAGLLEGTTLRGLARELLGGLAEERIVGLDLTAADAADTDSEFPLSHGQKALWFLQRMAPAGAAYNIAAAARLAGVVDAEALRRAFQELVDRHAALRTTYHDRAGQPLQRVHAALAVGFSVEEAPGLDGEELAARLRRELYRPFDLEKGPLLRVVLLRLGPAEHSPHVLGIAVHHIAADFWSLAVLADELGALYAGEIAPPGDGDPLPALSPPPVTYGDYVRWQAARLAGAEGERLWSWWRQALPTALADLDLPTDRSRPAVQTERGGVRGLDLGPELSERLQRLAQSSGATLFMVLLAGFQALLHRYTGQRELAVGCPVAGRGARELAGVVGYFVNPVVVRGEAAGDLQFQHFLAQIRQAALGALEHQEYPFALLTERLQPVRDPSRSPLFQAMFVFQKSHLPQQRALAPFALGRAGAEIQLGPLVLSALPLGERPAQLDLTLEVAEVEPEGLAASLVFNADLFDAATAERLLAHWRTLLAGAAVDPGRTLLALPLLAPAEEAQILVEWNATAFENPRESTVYELIAEQAERTPERVALTAGHEALSYRELLSRANRLARHLEGMGVGPEVPVGVFTDRTSDMLVGLLGVLAAGGAYVPIDPAYPAERVTYMLADSGAPVVLTQERLCPALAGYGGRLVCLDSVSRDAGREPLGRLIVKRRSGPDNLAYIIYTSGSTGRPKGVQISHRAVVNFLTSMARRPGLGASDVLVSVTTISFDIAGLELYLPLIRGARVVLADRETTSDGVALRRLLASSGATALQATPATWRLLLAAGWAGLDGPLPIVLCGGEALPRELAERLHERAGAVWNLYGPTETTIWSAVHAVERGGGGAAVAIGRPIANTGLFLLDAALRPVPVGVAGELLIGGDGLARGYRGRPDLTAEKFIPDPVSGAAGARLYRTGDLARFQPGGEIEFLGRLDHQVKIRGFRIELSEVEAALAAHPAVRQTVAVARAEAGGGHRLVAYVVFAEGGAPGAPGSQGVAELRRFLAERLPDPFIPSIFVALDRLPLTPNGKVDRKALPVPESVAAARTAPAAPASGLERTIAEIWREILQVEKVGLHDNFFDLGGHSLLAAELHSRLREVLGRELSVVDLFRHPTVGALARFLAPGGEAAGSALPALVAHPAPMGREIAIIGMAGRFPGAPTVAEFWRRLRAGEELITFFSDDELAAAGVEPSLLTDPAFVRAGGVIEGAELFDPAFFGLSPREAELMDPQHRIFLECAWHALEDAGYYAERHAGQIGLYAGVGINTYLHHAGVERMQELAGRYQAFIANDKDFVSTRASYKLNLKGPSVNVQTACSTSLVALHLACQGLAAGDCDMALAGGVAVRTPQTTGYLYEAGGIPSPDGHCRAFDARAAGTVFGNGAGLVVLKPLARALADGDTVYAVIKGTAINNDGALKVGYTAPSVEGQARVIAAAFAAAGVGPETVTYVEAHGTGTPMGDPIEVAALTEVFAPRAPRPGFCALGSVKTNIGHLDTAAGVAGLIKTVQALVHRELPPSLHYETPNPRIDFATSPFRVNAALVPWDSSPGNDRPRRAGVSSFGIGGTNAHVVLEEAPEVEPSGPSRPWQVLVLSARTPAALDAATGALAVALRERPDLPLADVAHTLQVGRKAFAHRRVLVCREREEAAVALAAVDPERVVSGVSEVAERGERPVAFLFSGQGSQHTGMARGLYAAEPVFRRELDLCAEILRPHLGRDLRKLLFPAADGGEAAARELARTELAQPALFAVEYALAQLWMTWGVRPQAMLGHSLGEYVAACLAGVLSLEDALALIAVRGSLMGGLPGGAMLGVQVPEAEIASLLASGLSLAAVNGPQACVVSGLETAVVALAARLDEQGVRHRRLHTSHAFHSAMMDPILDAYAAAVGKVVLLAPQIPFVSNLTGTWITAAEATDPGYWVRHVRGAVRFADGVRALLAEPDRVLLEVGPGNVLSTLARLSAPVPVTERRLVLASLPHPQEEQPEEAVVLRTLGRLWLAGAAVDWEAFAAGERRRRVQLPLYPFERQRYWLEAGKPTAKEIDRLAKKADLADWFYAPLWRQGLPPIAEPDERSSWLLLGDSEGPGARLLAGLAERLERYGRPVVLARAASSVPAAASGFANTGFSRLGPGSYTLDPGRREDWDALFTALREAGRLPQRIVHAWNVTGGADTPPEGLLPRLTGARVRAFDSVIFLAQALEAAGAEAVRGVRVTLLSDGLQRVTGERALSPEKALLLGPVKVIPQEIPGLSFRSVDLLLPATGSAEEAELVEDLLAEASGVLDAAESVVAWRGGERWVRTFGPARLERDAGLVPRVREGGVYLLTGGLGGVALVLAEELAVLARVKLALVGRTALPPREEWAAARGLDGVAAERIRKVEALEALGAEVLTLAADVTDPAALTAALREAEERLGPVRGVVHAAGVPGGRLLQLLTPDAAAAVLAPKVCGTLALALALGDRPLDFFVLCSSINATIGGFGQSEYCAANAFLDAFAQASYARHRRRGPYIVSIGWDRWEEVGMAARSPLDVWQRGAAAPFHPLLDARIEETPGREVYASEMSVERHWVLSEHRILGHPSVPGTAYLEMARAAFARRAAGRPVEIREAIFLSPLVVLEGQRREVLTVLEGSGEACQWRVVSRLGEEPWQEHARGRVAVAAGTASEAGGERRNVAALLAACTAGEVTARRRASEFLTTGARWQSLRRLHLGVGECVAELELDERFAADLAHYALHPALLDVAAGAVQLLGDGDYLPLTYDRLLVHAPLTRKGFSHFRLRDGGDILTCDITLLDESGGVRVEVEGFSMKRVGREAAAQLRQTAAAAAATGMATGARRNTGGGILPSQGRQVLRRILRDGVLPQYMVSTRDLEAVAAAANAFDRSRLAGALEGLTPTAAVHARPEVSSAYAPPADDLERRIAEIWVKVLGIERVGTSLSGIQLVSELKKQLGVEVPTVSIFQAPTVSALVRYLRPPAKQESDFDRGKIRAEKKQQVFAQARRAMGRGGR